MNHKGITFDPKLEELLREVAAEPDSCLLRAGKKASHKALFRTPEVVSHTSRRLLPAERDIVRYYREEVSWLLLELCHHLAVNDGRHGLVINRRILESDHTRVPAPGDLRRRGAQLSPLVDQTLKGPLALVSSCLAGDPSNADLGSVAVAASNLVSSPATRGYLRIHYTNQGLFTEASRLAEQVARQPGTTRSLVSNLHGRGRIAFEQADYLSARGHYSLSVEADPSRADSAAAWLLNSLITGCESNAIAAIEAFDAAVGTRGLSVQQFAVSLDAVVGSQHRVSVNKRFSLRVSENAGAARHLINELIR